MKEQGKIPEQLSEVETGNLSEKEFTGMITQIIKELKGRMDTQSKKLLLTFFSVMFYYRISSAVPHVTQQGLVYPFCV